MKEELLMEDNLESAICLNGQEDGISIKEVWFVDRIVFNVSSWHILGASAEDFKRIFQADFNPAMRKTKEFSYYRTFLSRRQTRSRFFLAASYHPDEGSIAVKMTIILNGNRLLRMDLHPGSEAAAKAESLDGNDNWISISGDYERAKSLQKRQACLIVEELDSITKSIGSSIEEALQLGSLSLCPPLIRLASVELNHNMETRDSLTFVASQAAEFGRVHKCGTQRQYPDRSSSSRLRNSLCLIGKISKGYHEKLYAKTETIARHEYSFSAYRIKQLLRSNRIRTPYLNQFSMMISVLERLVEKSHSRFGTPKLSSSVLEFPMDVVHRIANNVSDQKQFRILISLYSVDGIVRPTAANAGIIEKLHRKRILDRTGRGVYCFAGWDQYKANALRKVYLQ